MTTAIVLGAGTSLDYGYPSGAGLVEEMKNRLSRQANHEHSELLRDLKNHQPYSIDAFLNLFPKHDHEAKSLIAQILFECEHPDSQPSGEKDLYRFFFHEISEDKYEQYKIITFNYDRSLEHHLLRAILPSKNYVLNAAIESLEKLEIIHIHGRLPALPGEKNFQIQTQREQFPYGYGGQGYISKVNGQILHATDPSRFFQQEAIEQRKNSIRTHGQQFRTVYQSTETHQRAKEILDSAQRIFFLGFSYHELNMKILGFNWNKNYHPEKTIAGTCFGMSPVKKAEVRAVAPAIQLIDATNMELFSHHYSLGRPELVIR